MNRSKTQKQTIVIVIHTFNFLGIFLYPFHTEPIQLSKDQ